MKNKFSIAILMIHHTLCFSYTCLIPHATRSKAFLRILDRYPSDQGFVSRGGSCSLLSKPVPPKPSPNILQETFMDELTTTHLSKRARFSNLIKRLRETYPYLRIRSSYFDARARMHSKKEEAGVFTDKREPLAVVDHPISEYIDIETELNSDMTLRQSTAADNVDLSGTWTPIVTPEFKQDYDQYLANCSQSFMFRQVVINGIGYQKEIIRQLNHGVDLEIKAMNPAGNWLRTLVASDATVPLNTTITDPDGDSVEVEAWWEESGTKHRSWLRGKPRLHGGSFETIRYMESNDVLVCESMFHPPANQGNFRRGHVVWKYKRVE